MGKLSTPDWIKEGYKSRADWEKAKGIKSKKIPGKVFKIRQCPKCNSDNVGVVLTGEEGKKTHDWECKSCGWEGKDIKEREMGEDEFLAHMEKMGEK